MNEIDEKRLLRRSLGDNETYPNAFTTGVIIGDGLLVLKAGWIALRRRLAATAARRLRGTHVDRKVPR